MFGSCHPTAPGAHPAGSSTHSLPGLSFVVLTTQETRLHQSRQWHMAQLNTSHKINFFNHLWIKKWGWWGFFLQYSAHFRLYKWRIFCNFLIIRYFKQCSSSLLRVLSISKGFFVSTSYWWDKCTCKLNKLINKHFKFQCGFFFFFYHAFFLVYRFDSVPQYWTKQITRKKSVFLYIYMIHIHI